MEAVPTEQLGRETQSKIFLMVLKQNGKEHTLKNYRIKPSICWVADERHRD